MKRIAIIVEKNQSIGAVGNISAVLLGQASQIVPELFSNVPVLDKNGIRHTGIQYSTVILKAGQGQLLNLANQIKESYKEVSCVVFSEIGQNLHNRFAEYQQLISSSITEDTKIVGAIVVGDEEIIKPLTKKFSLL